MAAVSIRTVWSREQIAALKTDPEVLGYIQEAAQALAQDMAVLAPKRTGAGAASIEARPARARGAQDVGWDKLHYYLTILNNYANLGAGQRSNPYYHFAQEALERYNHI